MYMALSESNKDAVKSVFTYSSLGLEMGLCVAIGVAMGYYLDKYFQTYPYLSVIFTFFGVAASMKTIFVLFRKLKKENERDNSK